MSKRDDWKAFFGLWANSLCHRRPSKPALAARSVRLEMLEPRWVLTAPVANVGTNLGNPSNDGTYAIYEGGYDPLAEEFLQTGLVLNGNSPGTGPQTFVWDIDPNPNNCDPLAPNFSTCFTPNFTDGNELFGASPPAVTWSQLNNLGITDDQFFDDSHRAIISLKVSNSEGTSIDYGTLQVLNLSPQVTVQDVTPSTGPCGEPTATLHLAFTDLNPTENLIAYVDWNWDSAHGEPLPPNEPMPETLPITADGLGGYSIDASYAYAAAGSYFVLVRLVEGPIDFNNDQTIDSYVEDSLGGGSVTVTGSSGGTAASVLAEPYAATEGLDGPALSASITDAEGGTFQLQWDLNGDNNYSPGEPVSAPFVVPANTPTPGSSSAPITWAALTAAGMADSHAPHTIHVRAVEIGGCSPAAAPVNGALTVLNVAPTIGTLSAVQGPLSGCTIPAVTLTVPFTDPGIGDDPFNVHVAWGDGAEEDFPVIGSGGVYSLQVNHTYSSTGNKAISVTVADDEFAQDADSTNIIVNSGSGTAASVVANPYTATEGLDGAALSASITDAEGGTFQLQWDLNGDNVYSPGEPVSNSFVVPANTPTTGTSNAPVTWASLTAAGVADSHAPHTIHVRAVEIGGCSPAAAPVNGALTVLNVAPSIGALSAMQGPPSGCTIPAVTLTVPFTDPGIGDDPFNVHVAWGDGAEQDFPVTGSSGVYSLQVSHTYASTGLKPISVIVKDDELAQDADSTNVTVNGSGGGLATVAIAGAPAGSPEGTSISLSSSVNQSCASPINYAWSVTKNGNPFATGSAANFSFTPNDNGSYVVSLTVTDGGGPVAAAPKTITVSNVNPTVRPLSASQAAAVGCSLADVTLNGSFTDPGVLDTFTVSVNWGDGPAVLLPAGNIVMVGPGSYTFTAAHHYATTGSKPIAVTVTDKDSGPGTASTTASVAIGAAATACLDTSTNTLVVTATSGSDWVHINAPSGSVRVQSNFLSGPLDFPAGGVTNVVILLGGGDDVLTVAGNVTLNILAVGGDGVDVMTGGRGRNVLIGGDGADVLFGGRGEDVLIDSSTIYDANELALMAILNEWASSLDVNQRIAHLSNQIGGANQVAGIYFFLNGSSIIDDGDIDLLLGNQSTDWLLLHTAIEAIGGNQDVITDL